MIRGWRSLQRREPGLPFSPERSVPAPPSVGPYPLPPMTFVELSEGAMDFDGRPTQQCNKCSNSASTHTPNYRDSCRSPELAALSHSALIHRSAGQACIPSPRIRWCTPRRVCGTCIHPLPTSTTRATDVLWTVLQDGHRRPAAQQRCRKETRWNCSSRGSGTHPLRSP